MIGTTLAHYEITGHLGTGGMGEVYQATDTKLGRSVAIKLLPEAFARDAGRLARFEREARVLASVNHPHIAAIYGLEESGGRRFLVMELVGGKTLAERIKRGPIPVDEALELAKQIVEALKAAHEKGIIHRDLKPENIMVRFDGNIKVLDFGLAKHLLASPVDTVSVTGQILGTPGYMAPEQIRNQDASPTSDLFSFGIILYEMLTGQHPWPRQTVVEKLHAILHDAPAALPDDMTTKRIAAVVDRLLRKNPSERFDSAEALLKAIDDSTEPASAGSSTDVLPSIAVLPFVFLSEVEERKALSLGFADALITTLGGLEEIAVLPTAAILDYSAGSDPAAACRNLGVRYILQGNVQRLGSHWRISVQLFDGSIRKTTFAEILDFRLENVFDVQDEIGRRVVERFQGGFRRPSPKSRERYTADPDAYSEFMAGLRDSSSDQRERIESAASHLSKALEHDPEFGLAHATLSYVCMNLHVMFDPKPDLLDRAERHYRTALSLDQSLPEAHMARAWILWSPAKNFQHKEAISSLGQALALQPNLERAHNRMSSICWHIGRISEAFTANELAQRSNPKTVTSNLAACYAYIGDFERAREACETLLLKSPGNWYALRYLAICALAKGDTTLASQYLAEALKRAPNEPLLVSFQGILHARQNERTLALECVRRAVDSPRSLGHTHHTYYNIACVHAELAEHDKALAWLEHTVSTGFPCWSYFRIDPFLEKLRSHTEFIKLVAGLEQEYGSLKIERL
jgi:serine/threonine protein kinase/Tfp pilus assembly protein PilF